MIDHLGGPYSLHQFLEWACQFKILNFFNFRTGIGIANFGQMDLCLIFGVLYRLNIFNTVKNYKTT
jgi:hypothetical protein